MFQDGYWWQRNEDGMWKRDDTEFPWREEEIRELHEAIFKSRRGPVKPDKRCFANNPGQVDIYEVFPPLKLGKSEYRRYKERSKPRNDSQDKKVISKSSEISWWSIHDIHFFVSLHRTLLHQKMKEEAKIPPPSGLQRKSQEMKERKEMIKNVLPR